MPVSGQSKMLDILLDTLFRNDTLKSWSIFDEKSGCITVKLRFSGQNGGQKGLNIDHSGQTTFKRRSDSQTERDRMRAQHYKTKEGITTRSRSKIQKGCMDKIENPRFSDSFQTHSPPGMSQLTGHQLDHDSIHASISDTPPQYVSPNNEPHIPDNSPILHAPISIDQNINITPPGLQYEQSIHEDINEQFMFSSDGRQCPVEDVMSQYETVGASVDDGSVSDGSHEDSDVDSVKDDMLIEGCHNRSCAYGGASDKDYLDIFRCTKKKCGKFMICDKCRQDGGHMKHSRWIVFDHKANNT